MKSILDILADMEYIIEDADGDLCVLKRREPLNRGPPLE